MEASQKKILYLLALLLVAQSCLMLAVYIGQMGPQTRFGGDFIDFWLAGQQVAQGQLAKIYDATMLEEAIAYSEHLPDTVLWFVYPPYTLFVLWPLGHLTYHQAVIVWSLAPLFFYYRLLWRLAQPLGMAGSSADSRRAYLVLAACTLPFIMVNIFSGQVGAFIALLFMGAAYGWDRKPLLSGICIGLLAVKPQLGILWGVAALMAGKWRILAIALAVAITLAAASSLWLGLPIWAEYLHIAQRFSVYLGHGYERYDQMSLGLYVALRGGGAPDAVASFIQAIASVASFVVVALVFRRHDGRQPWRFALLACGALLFTPYALCYDTPLLALALVPLLAHAWRYGWHVPDMLAFIAVILLPYLQPQLMVRDMPLGIVALPLLFAVLYRRYRLAAL